MPLDRKNQPFLFFSFLINFLLSKNIQSFYELLQCNRTFMFPTLQRNRADIQSDKHLGGRQASERVWIHLWILQLLSPNHSNFNKSTSFHTTSENTSSNKSSSLHSSSDNKKSNITNTNHSESFHTIGSNHTNSINNNTHNTHSNNFSPVLPHPFDDSRNNKFSSNLSSSNSLATFFMCVCCPKLSTL